MRRHAVLLLLSGAIIVVAVIYLASWSRTHDHPYHGTVKRHYRLGLAMYETQDRNRDGVPDGKTYFDRTKQHGADSYLFAQQWDDPDFDGYFEFYSVLIAETRGPSRILAIDEDHDGYYELLLTGEDAWRVYRERVTGPYAD